MIQITDIGGDKREFYRPVRLCNTQHALKGQKLLAQCYYEHKQHALKGQKLLAQGIALGTMTISKAPCKGKSFVYCPVF